MTNINYSPKETENEKVQKAFEVMMGMLIDNVERGLSDAQRSLAIMRKQILGER